MFDGVVFAVVFSYLLSVFVYAGALFGVFVFAVLCVFCVFLLFSFRAVVCFLCYVLC